MAAIPQGGEYIFCATQGWPLNDIAIFFSSSLCKSLSLGDYLPYSMVMLVLIKIFECFAFSDDVNNFFFSSSLCKSLSFGDYPPVTQMVTQCWSSRYCFILNRLFRVHIMQDQQASMEMWFLTKFSTGSIPI